MRAHALTLSLSHTLSLSLTRRIWKQLWLGTFPAGSRETQVRDNLTLGTQGGLEAQSGLTVRLTSKVQCHGGQDKTIQPHLHCSKPHLCVGKISWPLRLHNTHPHTNAYTCNADMLCDCSPSTNLGHGDRTETTEILLPPPPPLPQ